MNKDVLIDALQVVTKRYPGMIPYTADGKLVVLGRYYYGRAHGSVRRMHIDRITIQHAPPDSRCESFRGEHICTSRLYSTVEAAWESCRLEAKRARESA